MISDKTVKDFIKTVYLTPQDILGGLKGEDRKMDNVHLVSIRLLSGTPIKGRGCKLDPILLRIGFTDLNGTDIANLSGDEINHLLRELKRFEDAIGAWTIVHDLPANETRAQWRLSADISPMNVLNASIETTAEVPSRKILCIDCEGVGIFIGKPKDKNKNSKNKEEEN